MLLQNIMINNIKCHKRTSPSNLSNAAIAVTRYHDNCIKCNNRISQLLLNVIIEISWSTVSNDITGLPTAQNIIQNLRRWKNVMYQEHCISTSLRWISSDLHLIIYLCQNTVCVKHQTITRMAKYAIKAELTV